MNLHTRTLFLNVLAGFACLVFGPIISSLSHDAPAPWNHILFITGVLLFLGGVALGVYMAGNAIRGN